MIDRLEHALSRVIDGGVAAVFRLHVQPAEIGRRLEHALLGSRRTSMGRVIGANHFYVSLHPDDFVAVASWSVALARELETWLGEVAFRHGITLMSPPQVAIEPDAAVRRRSVHVTADFSDTPGAKSATRGPAGRLIPLSHGGNVLTIDHRETTVGRAPGNDLVINAPEVSRAHARLERRGNTLEVKDLGSRNGTWVNGLRIVTHSAKSGDELAFGTLRFRLDLP